MSEKNKNTSPLSKTKVTLFAIVVVLIGLIAIGPSILKKLTRNEPSLVQMEDSEESIDRVIVVSMPEDGQFYLGREPVNSLEALREALQERLNRLPLDEKVIYIKAASKVSYGEVVRVGDIVKSLGLAPRLVTQKKSR